MQLVLVALLITAVAFCQDTYTAKYDNVDLDSIIKNERLFRTYIDCLLDKGKCSSDAEDLKKHIPEALESNCAKCTDKQKNGIRKVMKHLVANKREWFDELVQKYDPEGAYSKKYEDLIKSEGIQL